MPYTSANANEVNKGVRIGWIEMIVATITTSRSKRLGRVSFGSVSMIEIVLTANAADVIDPSMCEGDSVSTRVPKEKKKKCLNDVLKKSGGMCLTSVRVTKDRRDHRDSGYASPASVIVRSV
jgi:hypothetical protein